MQDIDTQKKRTNEIVKTIGPEEHLPNFLSVHLTKPYSGITAERKQTGKPAPPWADGCNLYQS